MREQDVVPPGPLDYLKALPQYLMPGHLVSRLMLRFTRIRHPAIRKPFVRWFVKSFGVNMDEAAESDPTAYEHFNAFFTRALKPGIRPFPADPQQIGCPVDGTGSQAGPISAGRVFQAKGRDYSLVQLLGGSESRAEPFLGGHFSTIYLSPRDYHRIHMPMDATLREMIHVPGRLFSVSPATTRVIPGLFARNERVICLFDTAVGPMAMVLVGAVFVAGIETVWHGLVTPPAGRIPRLWRYVEESAPRLARGDEMGRFNMGSTVILLFGPEAVQWADELKAGAPVRMGQPIGHAVK